MPYLGDHPDYEPVSFETPSAPDADILQRWCDQRGLYCPNCEYLLRGVEGAGMTQCPECGHPIDFDELRRRRLEGYDLGSFRQVAMGVLLRPWSYLRLLKGPQYYVRTGPEHNCFGWFLATTFIVTAVPLGVASISLDGGGAAMASCCPMMLVLIVAALAHLGAYWWFRALLRLAGRKATDRGASRIIYFASIAYLPLLVPLVMLIVAFLVAESKQLIGVSLHPLDALFAVAAMTLAILVAAHWGYVAMLVFNLETYGRSPMLGILALANPVTVVVAGVAALGLASSMMSLFDRFL